MHMHMHARHAGSLNKSVILNILHSALECTINKWGFVFIDGRVEPHKKEIKCGMLRGILREINLELHSRNMNNFEASLALILRHNPLTLSGWSFVCCEMMNRGSLCYVRTIKPLFSVCAWACVLNVWQILWQIVSMTLPYQLTYQC